MRITAPCPPYVDDYFFAVFIRLNLWEFTQNERRQDLKIFWVRIYGFVICKKYLHDESNATGNLTAENFIVDNFTAVNFAVRDLAEDNFTVRNFRVKFSTRCMLLCVPVQFFHVQPFKSFGYYKIWIFLSHRMRVKGNETTSHGYNIGYCLGLRRVSVDWECKVRL